MREIVIKSEAVSKSFVEVKRSLRHFFRPDQTVLKAVDNLSFEVYRNEVFGLLGANGSGKSTLIRLLATLLIPDSGKLTVFDYDVSKNIIEIRRLLNRVSVEASFFKKLSALENLRYTARLYGMTPDEGFEKAQAILTRLGIPEAKITTPLEHFSRGMQQKVAIARAFMTAPKLILLDEPTTGLDPISKREVLNYVNEVLRTQDLTIVLTTHDMNEAEQLCDRIAIIDHGKLIALDTPEKLKESVGAESMEEVFFTLTGKTWEEVQVE